MIEMLFVYTNIIPVTLNGIENVHQTKNSSYDISFKSFLCCASAGLAQSRFAECQETNRTVLVIIFVLIIAIKMERIRICYDSALVIQQAESKTLHLSPEVSANFLRGGSHTAIISFF
jgi:hypothetical protein